MNLKHIMQHTVLISWCFTMGYFIIFGSHGIVDYVKCYQKRHNAQKQTAELEKTIASLKKKIHTAQTDDFYREKRARYDFCMGYTNEMVYVIK